jgi:uncharacterized YigZ family protein
LNFKDDEIMVEKYLTIYKDKDAEIVIKKSRFIGTIKHVETEDDVKIFLEEIRKKHYNATHNVFAYTVGLEQPLERCSDDGEPSGTAGMPILEVIRGENLRNVIVVVTRYFGGTLLGTGGLVRAYSTSTKEVIECANIQQNILYYLISVTVDYTLSGKIQYEILQDSYIIYDTEYKDNVVYNILVEYDKKDIFEKKIIDITSGVAVIKNKGLYYGIHNNEQIILKQVDDIKINKKQ